MGAWTVAAENHRDNPNRCTSRKGVGSNRGFSRHELASRRRQTTGEGGNDPDAAKRQLTLDGGATIDESLYKYDAGAMSYSYRIDNVDVKVLPVNNYSSTIAVVPAEGGKSTVEWRGAFYRGYPNNDPPPELNDEAALKAVGKVYRAGLENLKKKVEAAK
jgi:Polyketide cyclase / dehydrase and lipid transport